jgi:hypothetical protein
MANTSCNTANVCALDVIVPRPSTNIMPKEFQSLLYILHFFGRVEMTRLNEFFLDDLTVSLGLLK